MVVDHFDNQDYRHVGLIYAAGRERRWRIVIGLEYQPRSAAEIERELAATVASEGMKTTRCPAHVGEGRCPSQHAKAPTNDLPLLGPEAADATFIRLAILCEPSTGPRNVDSLSTP